MLKLFNHVFVKKNISPVFKWSLCSKVRKKYFVFYDKTQEQDPFK